MAPELSKVVKVVILGHYHQFDIHYMYLSKDGTRLQKTITTIELQPVYYKTVTVNYTPNGVKSFADGGPTTDYNGIDI